jgi:hypothetical protein
LPHLLVEAVGLGEVADRFREPAHAQRVDDRDTEPLLVQCAMRQAVELARRLHHDRSDAQALEPAAQRLQALGRVAQAQGLAKRMEMDVEPLFTDVEADVHFRFEPTSLNSLSCQFSLRYERFEDSGFRSRTPGPPPFSAMNSMPEDSNARRIDRSFAAVSEV